MVNGMVNGLVYIDASASIIQSVCNIVNALLSGWVDLNAPDPITLLGRDYVNAFAAIAIGLAHTTALTMNIISF
jgi:hypothetical protein